MKTLRHTLAMLMIIFTTAAASAQPMSYIAMRNNARFLTDRMAYTLGLSAALIDELYLINYDYICGVNEYLDDVALGYRYDDYMEVVYARDYALRRLLNEAQWARLMAYDYFYRPISFLNNRWSFSIYAYDHRPTYFYYSAPRRFNDYRGGHYFRGMAAKPHYDGRPAGVRPGRDGGPRPGAGPGPRPNGGPRPNMGNNTRPGGPDIRPNGNQPGTPNPGMRPNPGNNAGPGNRGGENRPNIGNTRPSISVSPSHSTPNNNITAPSRPAAPSRPSAIGGSTRSAGAPHMSRPSAPTHSSGGVTRGAGRR